MAEQLTECQMLKWMARSKNVPARTMTLGGGSRRVG